VGVPRTGVRVIVGVPAVTDTAKIAGEGVASSVEIMVSTLASAMPMIEKFPWASRLLSSTERR
jgi:hypothetical protein